MIRRWLPILFVLGAGVWFGQQLLNGPGYILIALPDQAQTTVEMSVWTGLLLLIASWFAGVWLLKLLGWIMNPFVDMRRINRQRLQRRGMKLTMQGLVDMAHGRWKKARKKLERSADRTGMPLVNYLIAAHAAHYEGEDKEVDRLLKSAHASMSGADLAVELSQAGIQLDRGQSEQALATLMRLKEKIPNHPLILRQLKEAYQRLNDWKSLIGLIPELRRQHLFPEDNLEALEQEAYLRRFKQLMAHSELSVGLEAIQALWRDMPNRLQDKSELVLAYVDVLLRHKEYSLAERTLKVALNQHWSSSLIRKFGLLPEGSDSGRRLLEAEKWLQSRPNDAELLHTLGRLSQQQSLWGKAVEYYEASQRLSPKGDVCGELCRLLAALGEERKSQHYHHLAIKLMNQDLPDFPLPKRTLKDAQ